jgi:alpha-mannosidase
MDESLVPVVPFSSLAEQPVISDWLIVGPFVVETGASFEREYMYERHKILEIDYLVGAGGERALRPLQDQWVPNPYLGAPRLQWERLRETRIGLTRRAGDLLYRTVQRNAVFYLATYVDCDRDEIAFVEAYHSGMRLFLNGDTVWDQPYGQAKGLSLRQMLLPVRLQAGRNLFMAKIRPGYIADGVEFCLINFSVRPTAVSKDGIVAATPEITGLFFEPDADPRQVIQVRCANLGANRAIATVAIAGETTELTLDPAQSELLRLRAPQVEATGAPLSVELSLSVNGRAASVPFTYTPAPLPDPRGTGFVYSDFHFDTTYHEEQRVYAMGAFDIVRRYCEQFEKDPNFKGTLSEIDYLKPYFDMFPAHRAVLRQAHREGRAESDVFYNQPQALNCCGETFVRNMLYGQLWHEEVLGRRCYVYSPGDVFGHHAQMSQIAAKGECVGVGWDKSIFGFPPLFRHVSPDGTYLTHRRGHVDRRSALSMGLTSFLTGCDKTPPTDWLGELAPRVQMAVASEFHAAVEKESKDTGKPLPLTSRDMSLYHAGTALSRIELKIGNRIAENLLISAEKFSTFAGLLGADYPEKPLDKAWRQLLCGQHHDSITGTHNEISYIDLMVGYREACELAHGVLSDALNYLSRAAKASGAAHEKPLRLFNPHAWDRTDVCRATVALPAGWTEFGLRDAAGKAIPCQILNRDGDMVDLAFVATVPSLGYTTYYLTSKADMPAAETQRQDVTAIENETFRLEADPDRGGLTSLFDKRVNRELLNTSSDLVGAEVTVHKEVPNRHEEQHEMYTTGESLFGHDRPARVHALVGDVLQTLVIEQHLSDALPEVRHEISLIEGVGRIDCRILLEDYQYEDALFVVTYPTALSGAVPTFDDRYCAVARRESRGLLDFRTHQMVMFSGCAVYPADRWMDYGPSVVLDMGRTGKCSLGMTAIISPADGSLGDTADRLLMALTTKGIPVTPWPDEDQAPIGTLLPNVNDDLLYNDFRFVLVTADHPNRWAERILSTADRDAVEAFRTRMTAEAAALFTIDRDNREGKPIKTVVIGAPDAPRLKRLVARIARQLASGETIKLRAVGVTKAGRVDDYGVCLVNTGNIACSVERGGVLALLLFHTCHWYGATGNIEGRNFVPEQRTHAYTYSLFPHAGSWRGSHAYRQALEVNDPIVAVAVEGTGDALPETASFLSVDAPGVIVSTVKALGNPLAAMQGDVPPLPERGIALRFCEADGRPATGAFRFLPVIERAVEANLLERTGKPVPADGNHLPFSCGPFSIETLGIVTGALTDRRLPTVLGAQAESAQPVFVRSWEHDAGTMPMGYETVVASIGRDAEDLPGGKLGIKVNVVNDYVDIGAKGEVQLLLPKGWTADATAVSYDLKPLEHAVFPVVVTRPDAKAAGQVKIRYQRDGQEFQDVFEVGKAVEPNFSMRLEDGRLIAAVENPGTESLECELAIASPVETWPAAVVGPVSLAEITPRTMGLSLAPGERREVAFDVALTDNPVMSAWWAVGKLMANGRIYMRRVDRRGRRRAWSSGSWREAVRDGELPYTSG